MKRKFFLLFLLVFVFLFFTNFQANALGPCQQGCLSEMQSCGEDAWETWNDCDDYCWYTQFEYTLVLCIVYGIPPMPPEECYNYAFGMYTDCAYQCFIEYQSDMDDCEDDFDDCMDWCGPCGDGFCASPAENYGNCGWDCQTCGNFVCDDGETSTNCPSDCS